MASDSSAPESSSSKVATSDEKRDAEVDGDGVHGGRHDRGQRASRRRGRSRPRRNKVLQLSRRIASERTAVSSTSTCKCITAASATRRYHFRFGAKTENRQRPERTYQRENAEQALIDFIEDSIKESGHRRDDYSMLVLWGHAYDFAFGRSRTREGAIDAIDFVELSGMLQRLQDRMKERYRRTAMSAKSVRRSTSSASTLATSRPWSWRASCSLSRNFCWARRSASQFRAGPTTGSSIDSETLRAGS